MSRELRIAMALLVACCAAMPLHAADESGVSLAPGAGLVETQSGCAICHSLDYIVMNSPFLDAAGWQKVVTKMITVMGAPITPENAAIIVRYLAMNYGKDSARPDTALDATAGD